MICERRKPKTKVVRVRNIATIATLAPRHCLISSPPSAIALILLAVFASTTCAFSPAPHRNHFGVVVSNSNRVGVYDVSCRRHPSSCLFAEDASNEIKLNEEEEDGEEEEEEDDDDDEVDIITQKLRRNAENGPINPMKEHDKMMKENEDEAKAHTNLVVDGNDNSTAASSALYSYAIANSIDPDFDPAASTDEAYVESQFKELLSRKGEVLSKLGPGIATLPLDPASDEAKAEDELAQKEIELQDVIDEAKSVGTEKWDEANLEKSQKKQSEIFEKAHKLQSEIDQLHVDDCGRVLLANLAFYEAFSLQDPEGMRDVWWKSPSVMCVHPSHPPLIGSNAVCDSFATVFENGMKGRVRLGGGDAKPSGAVYMTPTNIRGLSVRGSTASLVCDEEVFSKGSAGESTSLHGALLVNKLLTTNVFRKIGGSWKMVHRHASWHPETMAAQEAMKAEPGVVLYDEKKDDATSGASNSSGSKRAEGMTLRKSDGEGTSKRPSGLPSIPSSLDGLDANAVLGIPTPKEEEPPKSNGSGEDGVIGKIINLSDLLGGGGDSSSSESEEDKAIGDLLGDMLKGSADSDSSQRSGSGTPEDPFITRRVIKIGPDGIENLSGKNNKDNSDDDEVKEAVIDLRGKSEEERKEIMSNLVDNVMKDAGLPLPIADDDVVDASVSPVENKEGLRQKCIATLRKLSDHGLLSSKQKRLLLTDIITSSARGESSMVEVAYELLCTGEEDISSGEDELDTGMEDFTEQCRVFASMGDE